MSTFTVLYNNFPRTAFWINRLTKSNYDADMELLPVLCDITKTTIDVGAKIGMYTYRMSPHSGQVIAFEPLPELFSLLNIVFRKVKNIKIVNAALSNVAGKAKLRTPVYRLGFPKYGQATIEEENQLAFPNVQNIWEYDVKLQTLDHYGNDPVALIKIDVEGHELSVLKGGKKLLKKYKPALVIEAQDLLIKDGVKKVRDFLEPLGYEGCFIADGKIYRLKDFDLKKSPDVKNFIFIHKSKKMDLKKMQALLKD